MKTLISACLIFSFLACAAVYRGHRAHVQTQPQQPQKKCSDEHSAWVTP